MEAITASLERSLQNCSLNNNTTTTDATAAAGIGISSTTTSNSSDDNHHHVSNNNSDDTALELNSHISLPYHWEQCLDLKTGEIYYINWRNGMKAKEDPRRTAAAAAAEAESELEEEEEEEEEECWYDSEEESCSSECSSSISQLYDKEKQNNNVLVVAGCKSCLMYFMVPKQVEDCPKCSGQLLHFDRSQNSSP